MGMLLQQAMPAQTHLYNLLSPIVRQASPPAEDSAWSEANMLHQSVACIGRVRWVSCNSEAEMCPCQSDTAAAQLPCNVAVASCFNHSARLPVLCLEPFSGICCISQQADTIAISFTVIRCVPQGRGQCQHSPSDSPMSFAPLSIRGSCKTRRSITVLRRPAQLHQYEKVRQLCGNRCYESTTS